MIVIYGRTSYEYDTLGAKEREIMAEEIKLAYSKIQKKEIKELVKEPIVEVVIEKHSKKISE